MAEELPRGLRNCNPGNVRYDGTAWQGLLRADPDGFCVFDTPANGIRAIGRILRSKQARDGLNTVDAIVRSYSATDQAAYVANMAAALGVKPDDPIVVATNLPKMVEVIIQQENGQQPYAPADIEQWVYG